MLIEKEVFNKINTVNKNLNKLSKYKSNQNPYETFLNIVNEQVKQKD